MVEGKLRQRRPAVLEETQNALEISAKKVDFRFLGNSESVQEVAALLAERRKLWSWVHPQSGRERHAAAAAEGVLLQTERPSESTDPLRKTTNAAFPFQY